MDSTDSVDTRKTGGAARGNACRASGKANTDMLALVKMGERFAAAVREFAEEHSEHSDSTSDEVAYAVTACNGFRWCLAQFVGSLDTMTVAPPRGGQHDSPRNSRDVVDEIEPDATVR